MPSKDIELIYFITASEVLLSDLNNSIKQNETYSDIFTSFSANIKTLIDTIRIPYELSISKTKLDLYKNIITKERILNTPLVTETNVDEKKHNDRITHLATKKFFETIEKKETKEWAKTQIESFLIDCYESSKDLQIAISESLNLACINTWACFEVFCRDFCQLAINKKPDLIDVIRKNSILKDKFNTKNISIEILKEYNYNISNNLGEILIPENDFSNLSILKETLCCIVKDKQLNKLLNSPDLYYLNQKRHLLVHKKGIIDDYFIKNTIHQGNLGSKLSIKPEDLKNDLRLIIDIAIELTKHISQK